MNFIQFRITEDMDSPSKAKFRVRLWMPPKGAEVPSNSPWSAENEMAAFSALKAQMT